MTSVDTLDEFRHNFYQENDDLEYALGYHTAVHPEHVEKMIKMYGADFASGYYHGIKEFTNFINELSCTGVLSQLPHNHEIMKFYNLKSDVGHELSERDLDTAKPKNQFDKPKVE